MELYDAITLGSVGFLVILIIVMMRLVVSLKAEVQAKGDDADQLTQLDVRLRTMAEQSHQREQAVRDEFRQNREETSKAVGAFGDRVSQMGATQTDQQQKFREELNQSLSLLGEIVRKLGADQSAQQQQFRDKLDDKMKELRTENAQKLDEMRKTVDEKLQTTLERRLSESFKTVSERLEAVQRGLGEMQNLATGVGDLKRVLSNVKARGTFGEVQLKILIDDFLTPDQFKENYDCGFTTGTKRVEFGVRMPGDEARYLPIDAKFPKEDYDRLLDAYEAGDKDGVAQAGKDLSKRVREFAKDISTKYINPPHTTNEAILFVPTESLYAEILRTPGLVENLQRDFSVTVTGPTNLQVLLSTFRMGYQQAVMQEQAAEVWKLLGAVKNEFGKYGDQILAMNKSLEAAQRHVEKLDVRKRVMMKALKNVEELDSDKGTLLLGDDTD